MREFDEYIARIRAGLHVDGRRADDICAELRSHLEAEVRRLQHTGLAHQDAVAAAIGRFGDPDGLAQNLAKANFRHRMRGYEMAKRFVVYTALTLLVAATVVWIRHPDAFKRQPRMSPLQLAAYNGRTNEVEQLLAKGADPNALDKEYGWTPLHAAAAGGHLPVVRLLLARGAKVNALDKRGATPLECAARGHTAVVRLLLDHGADPNLAGHPCCRPLRTAAALSRDPRVLTLLLDHGADTRGAEGTYDLYWAIMWRRSENVKLLLAAGAPLDVHTGQHSGTVLHAAAQSPCADLIPVLLARGARVDARDRQGRTPLHSAAACARTQAVLALLSAGADVNARDRAGATPLLLVGGWAPYLVTQGVKRPAERERRVAEESGRDAAVALVAHGANVNLVSNDGRTPLMHAVLKRDPAWVRLLLRAGAHVNAADRAGWTPLHYAAAKDEAEIAAILLAAGADVNAATREGATPLSLAKTADTVQLLRKHGGTG